MPVSFFIENVISAFFQVAGLPSLHFHKSTSATFGFWRLIGRLPRPMVSQPHSAFAGAALANNRVTPAARAVSSEMDFFMVFSGFLCCCPPGDSKRPSL